MSDQPTTPQAAEPYGATLLRQLYDDCVCMLMEYDQAMAPLDNPAVRQFVLEFLKALERQYVGGAEKLFKKTYKELPPLAGEPAPEGEASLEGGEPPAEGEDVAVEMSPDETPPEFGSPEMGPEEEAEAPPDAPPKKGEKSLGRKAARHVITERNPHTDKGKLRMLGGEPTPRTDVIVYDEEGFLHEGPVPPRLRSNATDYGAEQIARDRARGYADSDEIDDVSVNGLPLKRGGRRRRPEGYLAAPEDEPLESDGGGKSVRYAQKEVRKDYLDTALTARDAAIQGWGGDPISYEDEDFSGAAAAETAAFTEAAGRAGRSYPSQDAPRGEVRHVNDSVQAMEDLAERRRYGEGEFAEKRAPRKTFDGMGEEPSGRPDSRGRGRPSAEDVVEGMRTKNEKSILFSIAPLGPGKGFSVVERRGKSLRRAVVGVKGVNAYLARFKGPGAKSLLDGVAKRLNAGMRAEFALAKALCPECKASPCGCALSKGFGFDWNGFVEGMANFTLPVTVATAAGAAVNNYIRRRQMRDANKFDEAADAADTSKYNDRVAARGSQNVRPSEGAKPDGPADAQKSVKSRPDDPHGAWGEDGGPVYEEHDGDPHPDDVFPPARRPGVSDHEYAQQYHNEQMRFFGRSSLKSARADVLPPGEEVDGAALHGQKAQRHYVVDPNPGNDNQGKRNMSGPAYDVLGYDENMEFVEHHDRYGSEPRARAAAGRAANSANADAQNTEVTANGLLVPKNDGKSARGQKAVRKDALDEGITFVEQNLEGLDEATADEYGWQAAEGRVRRDDRQRGRDYADTNRDYGDTNRALSDIYMQRSRNRPGHTAEDVAERNQARADAAEAMEANRQAGGKSMPGSEQWAKEEAAEPAHGGPEWASLFDDSDKESLKLTGDFLKEAAQAEDWGDQKRLDAYHLSKLLAPAYDRGQKYLEGAPADDFGSRLKTCGQCAGFLEELSRERAFGDPHRQMAGYFAKEVEDLLSMIAPGERGGARPTEEQAAAASFGEMEEKGLKELFEAVQAQQTQLAELAKAVDTRGVEAGKEGYRDARSQGMNQALSRVEASLAAEDAVQELGGGGADKSDTSDEIWGRTEKYP
jgi:hypothetical protein